MTEHVWTPVRFEHPGGTGQGGHQVALACRGRTKLGLLVMDVPVRILRVPLAEHAYCAELTYHGKPYPLDKAVRQFRRAGRRLGITKSARKVLKSLAPKKGGG